MRGGKRVEKEREKMGGLILMSVSILLMFLTVL